MSLIRGTGLVLKPPNRCYSVAIDELLTKTTTSAVLVWAWSAHAHAHAHLLQVGAACLPADGFTDSAPRGPAADAQLKCNTVTSQWGFILKSCGWNAFIFIRCSRLSSKMVKSTNRFLLKPRGEVTDDFLFVTSCLCCAIKQKGRKWPFNSFFGPTMVVVFRDLIMWHCQ